MPTKVTVTLTTSSSDDINIIRRGKYERRRNFPETLYDLIETPGAVDNILQWVAGGTAFIITDRDRFINETLPLHFKGIQYKSFIRKINLWNFRRVTRGPFAGAYHHPFFNRANRSLCRLMKCSPIGVQQERRASGP